MPPSKTSLASILLRDANAVADSGILVVINNYVARGCTLIVKCPSSVIVGKASSTVKRKAVVKVARF